MLRDAANYWLPLSVARRLLALYFLSSAGEGTLGIGMGIGACGFFASGINSFGRSGGVDDSHDGGRSTS